MNAAVQRRSIGAGERAVLRAAARPQRLAIAG